MRCLCLVAILSLLLTPLAAAESVPGQSVPGQSVPGQLAQGQLAQGQYVEARNANAWAGPCLFNAEVRLTGDVAVMAWKVDSGSYQDVQLDGLGIVAVVEGDQTFGIGEAVKTKTVFIVDSQATPEQRQALMDMAKALAGDTIQEVVRVDEAQIQMSIGEGSARGFSVVDAGPAQLRTRPVRPSDHSCGGGRLAYPMLAKAADECPAFTLQHEYRGGDLTVKRLESNNLLSGVIGRFSL